MAAQCSRRCIILYIQQDLTVKQREKRRELVQQLKFRKAQGEVNLIIVRDKIVKNGKDSSRNRQSSSNEQVGVGGAGA